jgi:hypothetical protein
MKKPTIKLVLRRETLRTLTNADLGRAIGGGDGVVGQSNKDVCTAQNGVGTTTPPA